LPARKAAFIHSEELEKYSYPENCPFKAQRAGQVRKTLLNMGLLSGDGIGEVPPAAADRMVVKKFHSPRYLHALKSASKGKWTPEALHMGIGQEDTPLFFGMYEYALLATGATLTGARLILSGQADVAFNPSGGYHHAFPEKAAGFCYINDNVIASMALTEADKRVLYLDVDVHHGDGVAHAFYQRPDVMTISFHENPKMLYPGTGFEDEIGDGPGRGYCVNLPIPVGTFDQAYLHAFDEIAMPLIKAYAPDVIVFELGADTLSGDPLAHLQLTNNAYVDMINRLLSFGLPVLMTGGGGYHFDNAVRAWALAWTVLSGQDVADGLEAAVGGVMLESTDWQGGLRDRELAVSDQQRQQVLPVLDASIETIKAKVFPIHGL
jgi:acetoin utilization protein AcuC